MITGFLITVFSTAAAALVGLFPSWTPPDWLDTAVTTLGQAVGDITMLSGWVPVRAVGTVVAFMLAASGVALAVRVSRIVLSLFTGGGGSAA